MRIFYTVLFCAAGLFNLLAGVIDMKWYIDYWVTRGKTYKKRSRTKVRVLICIAGIILTVYGAAYGYGLI